MYFLHLLCAKMTSHCLMSRRHGTMARLNKPYVIFYPSITWRSIQNEPDTFLRSHASKNWCNRKFGFVSWLSMSMQKLIFYTIHTEHTTGKEFTKYFRTSRWGWTVPKDVKNSGTTGFYAQGYPACSSRMIGSFATFLLATWPVRYLPFRYLAFSLPVFFATLIFSSQPVTYKIRKAMNVRFVFILYLFIYFYLQQNILKMN